MSIFVFVNNLNTTLASAINSTATTITLTSSAHLPALATGQQIMPLTLNDAATGLVYEIVYVTAISGTSLTIVRGQEGTTAQAWNAGDYALCCPTAQSVQPLIGTIQPTVSGTLPVGNDVIVQPGTLSAAITLTLPSAPTPGSKYTIYGSASAFTVTVQTSVSSGSPYMGFPGASNVYGSAIAASSPMQGLVCIWDGTNWRCTVMSPVLTLPPWYAADTGSVNAYAAIYVPAVTTLTDGLYLAFATPRANTGASTFSANGTPYPILAANTMLPLQGGEIIAGGRCVVMWTAYFASWILFSGGAGALPVADATQSQHALNLETGDGRYLLSDAGRVAFFAMSTAPTGYLKANGAAISRATYANLYSAIGTTFGVGDGSTTFNLPDLRGEFLRGYDDSKGTDPGRTFGSWQKGSLQGYDAGRNAVWCLTLPDESLATAQTDIGVDPYSTGDYSNASLNQATANFVNQALPGDPSGGSGKDYGTGVTRPRNIALLACIKY